MKVCLISTCAPFVGEKQSMQNLAAYSWNLQNFNDVVLFGNDVGVSDICSKYGWTQLKEINTGESVGIDNKAILLNDAFNKLLKKSNADIFLWLNSDLTLITEDVQEKLKHVCNHTCSAGVGRRRDWEDFKILFSQTNEETFQILKETYKEQTILHNWHGIDLFYWTRPVFENLASVIPPFIANGWRTDHYFLWYLWKRYSWINCWDVSEYIEIIHPKHNTKIQTTKGWNASHKYNTRLFNYSMDLKFPVPETFKEEK